MPRHLTTRRCHRRRACCGSILAIARESILRQSSSSALPSRRASSARVRLHHPDLPGPSGAMVAAPARCRSQGAATVPLGPCHLQLTAVRGAKAARAQTVRRRVCGPSGSLRARWLQRLPPPSSRQLEVNSTRGGKELSTLTQGVRCAIAAAAAAAAWQHPWATALANLCVRTTRRYHLTPWPPRRRPHFCKLTAVAGRATTSPEGRALRHLWPMRLARHRYSRALATRENATRLLLLPTWTSSSRWRARWARRR